MYTLRQYLFSVTDSYGLTRTLGEIALCRTAEGRPSYTVGNAAVVFRIRHEGRIRALRCYFRPMRHLESCYGEALLREELFLYETPTTGRWVDVVLTDWVKGVPLQEAIGEAATAADCDRLAQLSNAFDKLAAELLADDWAHGDLKPDNLIIDAEGVLHPIDFDARFLPAMRGMRAVELGTAAYQHPNRTAAWFDERLDDYPAALISTALYALSVDPSLYTRFGGRDGLLFDPSKIACDEAYREVMTLFARRGEVLRYRIGEALTGLSYRQPQLIDLFRALVAESKRAERRDVPAAESAIDPVAAAVVGSTPPTTEPVWPELFVEQGRWGFRTAERVVISPLYDEGFDFSEGLAAVRVGAWWHFIDPAGRVVLHCPACDAVKPFRNGYAVIVCGKQRHKMDKSGNLFDF